VAESSLESDASRLRALALARRAIEQRPAGLLTDFDGTLAPIVRDPFAAQLVDGADGALATLARRLAVVAIITGRAPLDARRLFGVAGVLIAGNHGTEWLEPDADAPTLAPEAGSVRARLDAVLARLPRLTGVVVEHKGLSASVHYRNAPDPDLALRRILDVLGDVGEYGLEARGGRKIVELLPIGLGNKGSAVRAIVERFGLRGVVVMGDDLTDLDMFRAVAELRDEGRVRGAIIGVGAADGEVSEAVARAADVTLDDPSDVAAFLSGLAAS
jgi:trehalose 6-phosphate phosphatase